MNTRIITQNCERVIFISVFCNSYLVLALPSVLPKAHFIFTLVLKKTYLKKKTGKIMCDKIYLTKLESILCYRKRVKFLAYYKLLYSIF